MTFTPERSDAIRQGLIEAAEHDLAPGRQPFTGPRRWAAGAVLVLLGAGAGAGVSAAAFASSGSDAPAVGDPSGQPSPDLGDAVPAPPGVLPGEPIVSMLGAPTSRTSSGTQTIALPERAAGATHLRVSISCLTPGTTSWATDGGTGGAGDGVSISCTASDLAEFGGGYYDFPLDDTVTSLELGAAPDVSVAVTLQYVTYVPTALGVNEHGQTFGVQTEHGPVPDLVAVIGVDPDGDAVQGYVPAAAFTDFGPDWPGQPSTPDEALAWQEERDAAYPDGWDLKVFASDGTTQVGTFHVGG